MAFELEKMDSPAGTASTGNLTCESCGAEFTCNAGQETCWCFEVKLSEETLAAAAKQSDRCLCRECLEKIEGISHEINVS